LTIKHDAVVERVSEQASGIQMSLSPRVDCAWDNVTAKSAARYGPIYLVVIQEHIADHQHVVIAVRSVCSTCTAAKQDDSVSVKSFNETRGTASASLTSCIDPWRMWFI